MLTADCTGQSRTSGPSRAGCHPRAVVSRAAAARRRSRTSVGRNHPDRPGTARRTDSPHRRTPRRAAALPLRPAERGACRGDGAGRGGRGGAAHTVRPV